ncbi:hypothetical protein P7C71_g640, partial [Lecanoromycetidae sp. Uapishka_2]
MSLSALFNRSTAKHDIPLLPLHNSHPSTPYRTAPSSPNPQPLRPDPAKMSSPHIPQSDALLSLSRQEVHLQNTIQSLLDAQSEGLLAGLGGGAGQDEVSSVGSRTPTTENSARLRKSRSPVPVRQPVKRKLGLRGARRGLSRAISDLVDLKGQELSVLEDEVFQRKEVVDTIQNFQRKSTGLKDRIRDIESEDTSRRVEDLKGEATALETEIHDMETKLYEMKARQRHLLREIDGLNNSVQSKLSSYKSALVLAEKDIKRFLARPPLGGATATATPKDGIWALPKERRTLELARDHYTEEQAALHTHISAVSTEQAALEEGGEVWEEVVNEVSAVEKLLREEMQRMQAPNQLLETSGEQRDASHGMKRILKSMHKARAKIEEKLDLAQTKGWKLLMVCIGAELEAMVEGMGVLEGALEAAGGASGGEGDQEVLDAEHPTQQRNGTKQGRENEDGELARVVSQEDEPPKELLGRSEEEEDGPGADLLISTHDDE